jgi:23S rRNA (cytidine1920-2'-O)/16S rRNA (cytidine1409-2'-O)-methyltransferase
MRAAARAMRADRLLVARGLAPTRSAAQRLIAHGGVRWRAGEGWSALRKAGEELPDECALEVVDDAELRWASRAGLKLEAALAHTGVTVTARRCLDLGQSTGGFTDVLLSHGASQVVGVDVGHGQLHPRLAADPRVVALEGVNVRRLAAAAGPRLETALADAFDVVVADLSFISLVHALPAVARRLRAGGDALLLVKPQFELQPEDIGKGGLVRVSDPMARIGPRLLAAAGAAGLVVREVFASPVAGGDGNREAFVHAQPAPKAPA